MNKEPNPETGIAKAFQLILERAGYVPTPANNLKGQPEVARKVGELFMDYMVASIYDSGWEGFDPTNDLPGIAALLVDMVVYQENQ